MVISAAEIIILYCLTAARELQFHQLIITIFDAAKADRHAELAAQTQHSKHGMMLLQEYSSLALCDQRWANGKLCRANRTII